MGSGECFESRLVRAWNVRNLFHDLAQSLTPPTPDIQAVRHVEGILKLHAEQIWRLATIDLQLIGSTSLGTDICKDGCERSDRDYSLSLGSGEIYPEEWDAFFDRLKNDKGLYDVERGQKAISFKDKALKIPWEVVPTEGHFTYDLVQYPTLQGSRFRAERNQLWLEFYGGYPGARNATKVLKRLLPDLKSHVVEGLVYYQGHRMLEQTPDCALTDITGWVLFQSLMGAFEIYPVGDHWSPLKVLLRDAKQHDGDAECLHQVLLAAREDVSAIHRKAHKLPEVCCFPMRVAKMLLYMLGFLIAVLLSAIFNALFAAVENVDMPRLLDCAGDCLCNDCHNNAIWSNRLLRGEPSLCSFFNINHN